MFIAVLKGAFAGLNIGIKKKRNHTNKWLGDRSQGFEKEKLNQTQY